MVYIWKTLSITNLFLKLLTKCTKTQLNEDGQIEGFKILKVQSTLKAIARDWSFECAAEREQSYKRIIDAIESYYNPND